MNKWKLTAYFKKYIIEFEAPSWIILHPPSQRFNISIYKETLDMALVTFEIYLLRIIEFKNGCNMQYLALYNT